MDINIDGILSDWCGGARIVQLRTKYHLRHEVLFWDHVHGTGISPSERGEITQGRAGSSHALPWRAHESPQRAPDHATGERCGLTFPRKSRII